MISYPAQGWSPHRVVLASFYCCWCVIENHGIPEQLSFHPCHNFYLFSESINKTFAFYSISNIYAKWIDPTSTNVPGPDHRTTSMWGVVFANGRNMTLSVLTRKGWLRDALCISKIQDRMNVRIVKLYPIHPLFCHCQRPHRWNYSLPLSFPPSQNSWSSIGWVPGTCEVRAGSENILVSLIHYKFILPHLFKISLEYIHFFYLVLNLSYWNILLHLEKIKFPCYCLYI